MPQRSMFRRGDGEAEAASGGSGNLPRTEYFKLEDKGVAIIRFLTESAEWVDADAHAMVPVKARPADLPAERKWPATMGAVCRKTKGADGMPLFPDCVICDTPLTDTFGKPVRRSGRTWALAVMREVVLGDGSEALGGPARRDKVVGYRTLTREEAVLGEDGKPTGAVRTVPAVVVVNQAWKNFFSAVAGFLASPLLDGTLLDRDFHIVRKGSNKDSDYVITPLNPIPNSRGGVLDLRNPQDVSELGLDALGFVVDPTLPAEGIEGPDGEWHYRIVSWPERYDLDAIVSGQCSAEYYAKFFDVTKTLDKDGNVVPVGGSVTQGTVRPSGDVAPDALAAIAARVKGAGAQAAPVAAPVAVPTVAPVAQVGQVSSPPLINFK